MPFGQTQKVPDDHITCVPNSSRIGEIKDPEKRDDLMVSSNYIEVAEGFNAMIRRAENPLSGNMFTETRKILVSGLNIIGYIVPTTTLVMKNIN